MMTNARKKLTEPLESVTAIFGLLLLIALAVFAAFTVAGPAGFRGFDGGVCVSQPGVQWNDSGWAIPGMVGVRHGYTASVSGAIQACALHPGAAQQALYQAASLSDVALWACILLLAWRIITVARRAGPFTPAVATAMRRLGWVVLVGSLAAAFMRTLITDLLLDTMLTLPDSQFPNLAWEPVKAIVPGPALAGAALLTFARIVRLGAAMDDEIKGTV